MIRPALLLIACLTVVTFGCSCRYEDAWSRARPPTFSSTGVVVHRGQPVAGALVNFAVEMPDATRSGVIHSYQAVGFTGPDGAFRLKTFRDGDGAVAGHHRVRITIPVLTTPGEPQTSPPPSRIPARYSAFESSGLAAEVSATGPNEFMFQLGD